MRTRLLLMACVLAVSGCVHRSDPPTVEDLGARTISIMCGADFVIQGSVVSADQAPVGYAEIYFIDTGLDFPRGEVNREERVGTADRGGLMDQYYSHGWCMGVSFEALGVKPPNLEGMDDDVRTDAFHEALDAALTDASIPSAFAIEIRANGFATYRRDFDLNALPEQRGPHVLDLGAVVLERDQGTDSPRDDK